MSWGGRWYFRFLTPKLPRADIDALINQAAADGFVPDPGDVSNKLKALDWLHTASLEMRDRVHHDKQMAARVAWSCCVIPASEVNAYLRHEHGRADT